MKRIFSYLLNVDSVWSRLLCMLLYVQVYAFVFENFVFFFFEYMGVKFQPLDSWVLYALWMLVSVLPVTLYRGLDSVSSYFSLFIYLFGFIPIEHALFVTPIIEPRVACLYSVVLCCVMCLFLSVRPSRPLFRTMQLTPTIPLEYIEICTLVFSLLLFGVRVGQMHFVNILTDKELLYQMRHENYEKAQSTFGLLLYFQGWLGCAFYPFLMVCYLKNKQWIRFSLVMLGNLLLFMLDLQKITLLMPFAMLLLYHFLNKRGEAMNKRLHSSLCYSIVLFSLLLYLGSENKIVFAIGSIILLRTVCVAGWLTQFYFSFFAFHPMTHYSHINIVNAITHEYPYADPLGYAVAFGKQNANANFLLTDGYAAWGIGGIIFVSLLFYVLLHLINAISSRYQLSALFVALTPMLSSVLNVSLFTTLLTKGFFIMLILLMCTDNPMLLAAKGKKPKDSIQHGE